MIREPLPYPHANQISPWRTDPVACTCPEEPGAYFRASIACPGCVAWYLARSVHHPHELTMARDGTWQSRVDSIRARLDDFDPMRVLFERALAERGIA